MGITSANKNSITKNKFHGRWRALEISDTTKAVSIETAFIVLFKCLTIISQHNFVSHDM